MFSAFSADLNWRIVTLGSLIHSPPLLGWNTKGLSGLADLEAMRRRFAIRRGHAHTHGHRVPYGRAAVRPAGIHLKRPALALSSDLTVESVTVAKTVANQPLPLAHSGRFFWPPGGDLSQLILRAHDAGHAADAVAACR